MKRRPLGLALEMPAESEQSYRVDEDGAFVHGQIQIGANGMSMAAPPASAASTASSSSQSSSSSHHSSSSSSHQSSSQPKARSASSATGTQLTTEEAAELQALNAKKDTKLENLDFLDKLGEGNSSVVHHAVDRHTQQGYAVKRINIYDRSKRHQIIKELHTLYKCSCPNLISFHGAFFREGAISIVLELMDIGSLADVLAVVPYIPEPELAYFARSILAGLAYLRRSHKIHRDIKPSNICINSQAEAKLSDFGITTSLENTLAECNSFIGTSAYMSIERLVGQPYKYPSDIWSFGLVLLESALGRYPYDMNGVYIDMMQTIVNGASPGIPKESIVASTPNETAASAAASSPTPAYTATTPPSPPRFTRDFSHFIDCCLCKDPDKRSTAEELLLHPWFTKLKAHEQRSKADMSEWVRQARAEIDRRKRVSGDADTTNRMDTSTNGQLLSSSVGIASAQQQQNSNDPFLAGYNETQTGGENTVESQERNNVANAKGAFFEVKQLQ